MKIVNIQLPLPLRHSSMLSVIQTIGINFIVWRFPVVWSVPLEGKWCGGGGMVPKLFNFSILCIFLVRMLEDRAMCWQDQLAPEPPQCSRLNSHHHSPGNFYWGENIFPESIYLLTPAHIYCFASRLFNPWRSEEGWAGCCIEVATKFRGRFHNI